MAFCLDTDIVIEFFRGHEKVVKKIKEKLDDQELLFITPITLCELFRGSFLSRNPPQEAAKVKSFFDTCRLLDFSVGACEKYGQVYASLKKEGKLVDDADLMIGCLALSRNFILVTNNTSHFAKIKGLNVENWLK